MAESATPNTGDRRPATDVIVIGAGAAGLMAAIFAGRAGARVVALDAAPEIGAKILISGGGRCNVTHDVVRADDFNGNRNAIGKALRTFDVAQTIDFFATLGIELKREETGKLFPVTDRAKDVVDALLGAARDAGVEIMTGFKVTEIAFRRSQFAVTSANRETQTASSVILAAGGQSVPKTGSDGSGYALAKALGHTVTPTFPALVPLVIKPSHWITSLSGTSVEAELRVKSPTGRVLHRERGSMLFTHFGISGPVVLDISRHWIASQPAPLSASFLPDATFESLETELLNANPHSTLTSFFRRVLPERLAVTMMSETPLSRLSREERRDAIRSVTDLTLPVVRDRGFNYAEVTAGGVPLDEIELATMRSRRSEHLYLCGEILDVDGKIGGYNFQWAWASGRLAGISAAQSL